MARRNPNVSLNIDLEADASGARKDIASDLNKIEDDAKSTVRGIERAFENLSPELDTSEIRQALALADQLDGMVASFTVDTDLSEIKEAEQLARSLRSFQGRVDLTVEGRAELADTLDLAGKLDQLRRVKVEVQGREDLEKAARIADDLERRRTVPIDAQASDLVRLDDQIEEALTRGGEAGSEGIAGALAETDLSDVGGSMAEQLSGSLAATGPYAAAAATVGAVFGESFLEGFNNALPDARGDTVRALKNNLAGSELAEVGKVGGEVYSSGLAEGLTGAKDAAALIKSELGGIDEGLDLSEATRQAMALSEVFEVDLAESVASVDKLVSQGLVKNTQEGFNLLYDLGNQVGKEQLPEMLELTNEFSTALKALGIEGPKGLKMIGEMVEKGIFPQVDQAGEVFEELNETIINGGAAEALEQIGLSAEDMQQRIAGGGFEASSAVAEIASTLLAIDDNAQQASATTAIFGGNMGLLGDEAREAALQLFATADGTEAVGTGASDAADRIEESATGLDRLKRVAVDLGNELGTTVADGLDTLNALAELDFRSAASSAADFGEALGQRMLGPLGQLADKVGLDPFGPLKDGIDALTGKTDDFAESAGPAVAGAEALSTAAREGAPKVQELADGVTAAAGGMDQAKAAAEQLDAALQAFTDRFNGARVMRALEEDVAAATEAVKGLTASDYDLTTGFDITTEKGRNAATALEDLSIDTATLADAFIHGTATAGDLAAGQQRVEDTLRQVAAQMGLNESETDNLIARYGAVQSQIVTDALFHSENALAAVLAYQREIGAIPSYKSTTVATHFVSTGTRIYQTGGGFAEGGDVEAGVPITVGERGEELFVPDQDGQIVTAEETRQLLRGNSQARTMAASRASAGGGGGGGSAPVQVVFQGSGSGLDGLFFDWLRKGIKNRGGVDVVFA